MLFHYGVIFKFTHSCLKGTQNPLISCGDPLVPAHRLYSFKIPPTDVTYASYVFFDFKATNVRVLQVVAKDKICEGKLCDGQSTGSCGCIVARAKKHWALSLSLTCDELSEHVTGEESVTITSTALTSLLVHPSKSSHLLSSDAICPYDMEDAVIELCEDIANNQGLRLIGWFKPGVEDDQSVLSGSFSFHLCAVEPMLPLNGKQQSLVYGSPISFSVTFPDAVNETRPAKFAFGASCSKTFPQQTHASVAVAVDEERAPASGPADNSREMSQPQNRASIAPDVVAEEQPPRLVFAASSREMFQLQHPASSADAVDESGPPRLAFAASSREMFQSRNPASLADAVDEGGPPRLASAAFPRELFHPQTPGSLDDAVDETRPPRLGFAASSAETFHIQTPPTRDDNPRTPVQRQSPI